MKRLISIAVAIFMGGSLSAIPSSHAAEDPLDIALDYLDFMNYEKAIEYFDKALKDPILLGAGKSGQKGIRVQQAFAYYRLRIFEEAVDALKKELTLFPESLEARILLSFVYFEQGRGEDAAAASKEFLAAFEAVKKKKPKTNWKDLPRQHPNLGLPNYILGLCEKNGEIFRRPPRTFERRCSGTTTCCPAGFSSSTLPSCKRIGPKR